MHNPPSGLQTRAPAAEVISEIQKIMQPFRHGLDLEACLAENSAFQASFFLASNQVRLSNYVEPGSYRGVCGDIALNCGLKLQERFRESHIVHGATGNCATFGSAQHCFLLMWPKSEDQRIRQAFEALDYSRRVAEFPTGVILVDPSEHKVEADANKAGYNLTRQFQFSDKDFDPCMTFNYAGTKSLNAQPVGAVQEIAPELMQYCHPDAKICIGFSMPEGKSVPAACLLFSYQDQISRLTHEMMAGISSDSPLGRFLDKINRQFDEQSRLFPPLRLKPDSFSK